MLGRRPWSGAVHREELGADAGPGWRRSESERRKPWQPENAVIRQRKGQLTRARHRRSGRPEPDLPHHLSLAGATGEGQERAALRAKS